MLLAFYPSNSTMSFLFSLSNVYLTYQSIIYNLSRLFNLESGINEKITCKV